MARPATGAPRWNASRGCWEARVTVNGRREHIPMREIPRCTVPASRPSTCACSACKMARALAKRLSDKARREGRVPEGTAETVSEWYERYYEWRERRGRGAESVSDSRGRFRKWIEPQLGTLEMVRVTRDDLERFAELLDEHAAEETIAPKTAVNIWGEVTVGFSFAHRGHNKYGKNLALRVLSSDPSGGAAGPDSGTTKQKPFLRPDEIVKLLSCEAVALERRYVYAVAIYTAMRQGEIRGLRVGDVDLEAMQITVQRQLKSGREKARTKSGKARIVQIEPNLVPLLRLLIEGKGPQDRLLWVGAHNRCASYLREDLLTAGCTREALHVAKDDPQRARMKFHNLRDTCGTHMAVRRDPPQDVQWRLGHATPAMTEAYIANARYEAGANFGEPLPPLPAELLRRLPPEGASGNWPGFGVLVRKRAKNSGKVVEAPGIENSRERPHLSPDIAAEADARSSRSAGKTEVEAPSPPSPVNMSEGSDEPTVLVRSEQPKNETDRMLAELVAGLVAKGDIARAQAVLAAYQATREAPSDREPKPANVVPLAARRKG